MHRPMFLYTRVIEVLENPKQRKTLLIIFIVLCRIVCVCCTSALTANGLDARSSVRIATKYSLETGALVATRACKCDD